MLGWAFGPRNFMKNGGAGALACQLPIEPPVGRRQRLPHLRRHSDSIRVVFRPCPTLFCLTFHYAQFGEDLRLRLIHRQEVVAGIAVLRDTLAVLGVMAAVV